MTGMVIDMNEGSALAGFSALSDPSRLHILRMLVERGSHGVAAGDIAREIGASPSRTSFHLAALSRAGLVTSRREGRGVIYSIKLDQMSDLLRWLVNDCLGGNEELRAAVR